MDSLKNKVFSTE